VTDAQLAWLDAQLAVPAPYGTILAMHHPPVPSVLDLAATVELRDQSRLAAVLRGTDVRAILAGHLHYSTFATFAGIPVSVASATCDTQDLTVPQGGTRGRDGAQAYNLVHVYDDTIVHSVVPVLPVEAAQPLEFVDAAESRRRLAAAGIRIAPSLSSALRSDPPTAPIPVLH
jgi:3',5'-cyclic AMP phosphodiesterase CpdA